MSMSTIMSMSPEQEINNVGNQSSNLATAPTNVKNLKVRPVEPEPSRIEPLFHSQAQCPSQSQSKSQSQPEDFNILEYIKYSNSELFTKVVRHLKNEHNGIYQTLEIFSSKMLKNFSSLTSLNSSLQAEIANQKIQLEEMKKSRAESEA